MQNHFGLGVAWRWKDFFLFFSLPGQGFHDRTFRQTGGEAVAVGRRRLDDLGAGKVVVGWPAESG